MRRKTRAERAADAAISRVRSCLSEVEKNECLIAVAEVCEQCPTFTTDDVTMPIPVDVEPRVIGAIMRDAANYGLWQAL